MTYTPIAKAQLPTAHAVFTLHGFRNEETGEEHVALALGELTGAEPVLARVHSSCLTGDALFSLRCDCGAQLEEAMRLVAEAGRGVIVYLSQEGRGIGLMNKIRAYALQDAGLDTVEANEKLGFGADQRSYEAAIEIFRLLGVGQVRLMTNNPRKVAALTAAGLAVAERVPLKVGNNPHNARYLATKSGKLGHLL